MTHNGVSKGDSQLLWQHSSLSHTFYGTFITVFNAWCSIIRLIHSQLVSYTFLGVQFYAFLFIVPEIWRREELMSQRNWMV